LRDVFGQDQQDRRDNYPDNRSETPVCHHSLLEISPNDALGPTA